VAAEQVTEQVAQSLEEAARVTRHLNVKSISLFSGGLAVGVVVGFYIGYRFNKEKIRAEEFRRSEEEIATMREVYKAREARHDVARTREAKAAESEATKMPNKPAVDDLVKEKGYVAYSSASETAVEERPLPSPVPGVAPPRRTGARPIEAGSLPVHQLREEHFSKRTEGGQKDKNDGWVYAQELTQRSADRPYIIHQDEFALNESGFQQVTYTYYDKDDTLTDEDDTILSNRENLIGENTLRWGHGADDYNLVHIRNPKLELEFEICRTPRSFEEMVLGFQDDEPS
jgi:hypothetical protein